MAVDDVAQALIVLDQEAVRERLRHGDLSDLAHLQLTDDEKDVITAAAEVGEVEAFDFRGPAFAAFDYVSSNRELLSAGVRTDFRSYFQSRFGEAWTVQRMA